MLTGNVLRCCAALLPALLSAQAPRDLDAELRRVRAEVDAGRLSAGEARLQALFADAASRDGLLVRREKVIDELRRIAFAHGYRAPEPRELVQGELHEWIARSGRIDLTYSGAQTGDFVATADDAWLHPLRFAGDYSVELRGARYPDGEGGLRLYLDVGAAGAHVVLFGSAAAQVPVQVSYATAGGTRNLGVASSPLRAGAPFSVGVKVSTGAIAVSVDGRVVLRVDRAVPDWGQLALARVEFSKLRIEGLVTSAWFDAQRDRHRQAALVAFAARFEPRASAPEWLLEAPPRPDRQELAYPCPLTAEEAARLDAAVRWVDDERYHDALAEAAQRLAEGGAEPAWVFVRALAFAGKGELAQALACLDEVQRLHPEFARGARLRAQLRWRTGDHAAAIASLRELITKVPDDAAAAADLVVMELRRGRADLAAEQLAAARSRGAHSDALDRVAATLAKAERGPDWPRRFEYRSAHYEVASDIDTKTCVEVANVLEEALATFRAELGAIDLGERRLRVFVFAGESGYRAYYEDVLGSVRLHTSGLYSATLKQLLLWQSGDRERMLQTARHEGLHQYLDLALREPPIWFNEGLASYYETDSARGARRGAQATRALRLRALGAQSWLPLRDLLALEEAEFHADASRAYAQSWALVRLLREGSAIDKQRFRALFDGLRAGRHAALAEVLTPAVVAELDTRLQAWLAEQVPAAPGGR